MERSVGLAAAAVWSLCSVFLVTGAASAYSVPADPRHPTWHPSPSPAAARRGHYHHYHGPAASPSPSPRQDHRGVSPAPAWPHHHSAPAPAPAHHSPAPAPAPTAGADDDLPSLPPQAYARAPEPQQATTTPHFGFPLEPTVGVAAARPAGAPGGTGGGGEGYPFIGSNPTVPLPTGVTDTATVLPLPDTAGGKAVGRAAPGPGRAPAALMGLLVVFSAVLLSSWSWSL